jgi:hypothetical protein
MNKKSGGMTENILIMHKKAVLKRAWWNWLEEAVQRPGMQ